MYLQRVETPEKQPFILVAMPGFSQFATFVPDPEMPVTGGVLELGGESLELGGVELELA